MMTSHPAGWTATELAQAAASRQLELYYQPMVDLRSDRIVGAEALLRWRHPSSGLAATRSVHTAGRVVRPDAGNWHVGAVRSLPPDAQVASIGVAAVPARRQCVRESGRADVRCRIQRVLADADLPAEYLEIELTESVAFGNPAMFPTLEALRALGVLRGRRLRDGLFLPATSEVLPDHHAEDRPIVRRQARRTIPATNASCGR
jgi:predicted signal transduction protein with EAL and GGDEF domain